MTIEKTIYEFNMKILQAHKFYWHRDGASNYALYLSELLEKTGHHVAPFAMMDERNMPSPYSRYFVSKMELDDPMSVGFFDKIKYAGRMIYSCEAKRKMERLLITEKIDVAHIHNIYHHISPSILPVLKKRGIPIVMTLHDYKLVCPNYTMYHHGRAREEDARGWYLSCVKNKCHKNSRAESAVVTAEMIWHHKIMKYYEKYVDKFIAPSEFIMNKCVELGWPKEKFLRIPYAIDVNSFKAGGSGGAYVAYVGRLSEEKGIETLIEAATLTPEIPYRIVGSGPLENSLKKMAEDKNLKNIQFTGFQTGDALRKLIEGANIIVAPSVWYENYPLSVLEAKAMGKIVIASRIGGLPEMLPGELLFEPGDSRELARKISEWYTVSDEQLRKMGRLLRGEVEKYNAPEEHVRNIVGVYKVLVSS